MIDRSGKYRKKGEFVVREVESEFLIIPVNEDAVELDTAFVMNDTGAFIFQHLDGFKSLHEIAGLLALEFEVEGDVAIKDVEDFVSEIRARFLQETD